MKPLSIAFYQQGTPCHGASVRTKPLGGTESAMIYMAEALARRGHQVSIFNEADQVGLYEGVNYQSWKNFEAFSLRESPDIFLSVRSLLPLLAGRWGKVQIYFSPDAYDQPFLNRAFTMKFQSDPGENTEYEIGLYSLAFVKKFADHIFCVGNWQAETFIDRFRIPREKVSVVHNGVALSNFSNPPLSKRQKRLVYSSTPFRGLEFILRYFPMIREKVPEATLSIMSGMQLYGFSNGEDQGAYGSLYDLAKQPGVTLHGPLVKSEMAKVLAESRVLAYPNTFPETFCIAALEAQATGLPIVTTRLAGLEERVSDGEDGFLIPGLPSQESYQNAFIEKTIQLLTDDALWEKQNRKARLKSERFDYDILAKDWEAKFDTLLNQAHERGSENKWPLIPEVQALDVLLNGNPKKIELSSDLIHRNLAEALEEAGFCLLRSH